MKNEFVTVKQAFNLKKIGFNEPCLLVAYKNEKIDYKELSWHTASNTKIDKTTKEINKELDLGEDDKREDVIMPEGAAVPLIRQAFRWFRDNHNFHHYIEPIYRNGKVKYEFCVVASAADDKDFNEDELESYEEAESACLDELIKLLKEKTKV